MTTVPFSFNPLASPHLENPYPLFARAQREAPIFFSPLFATWVVTRYEDVRAILHDPRRFSSSYLFRTPVDPTPEVLEVLAHLPPEVGVLVNEDPPGHRRTRALVSNAFLPRQVARMEARIRAIAHACAPGISRAACRGRRFYQAMVQRPYAAQCPRYRCRPATQISADRSRLQPLYGGPHRGTPAPAPGGRVIGLAPGAGGGRAAFG